MKKTLISVALGALGLTAGAAHAVTDISLVAKEYTVNVPGTGNVTMWGYVLDPDNDNNGKGDCYQIGNAANRRACAEALPDPMAPGPRLDIPPGEKNVRLWLTNMLPENTSITIPGQEKPFSATNNGPTWTDGTVGPRTNASQRVRSFGREAGKNGGRRGYIWTNFRTNPFKPGNYLYHSATHPSKQVQMGLYGAIVQDVAAGEAYPGVTYDHEISLFYSEIDPVMHAAIDPNPASHTDGTYGTANGPTSMLDYKAQYFLVNGEQPSTSAAGPNALNSGGPVIEPGQTVLLRMYNTGYETHIPMLNNLRGSLVAEDGRVYPFAKDQYSVQLFSMKTKDMLITPNESGRYAIFDRAMSVANAGNAAVGGHGLVSFIDVSANANAPVAVDDSLTVAEESSGSDSMMTGDNLNGLPGTFEVLSGPSNGTLSGVNASTGAFTYTHDGSETTSDSFTYKVTTTAGFAQATVNITVNPVNDPPTANDDAASGEGAVAINIAVLDNDSDVDLPGDTLTVSVQSQPANGTATTDGTTVTYTPTGALPITGDTFTYLVNDGSVDSNVATVTVDVAAPVANTPPTAVDDAATTDAAVPVSINVLNNDSDAESGVTIVSATVPANGSVNIAGDGQSLSYSPTLGFSGPSDSFDYTIEDADGASATATVTVTVNNTTPEPAADFVGATKNTEARFAILSNDMDDGAPVVITEFDDPQGGALNNGEVNILGKRAQDANGNNLPLVNGHKVKVTKKGGTVYYDAATGEAVYNPPVNFRGTDIFNYRLKDAEGAQSDKAKVKITVTN